MTDTGEGIPPEAMPRLFEPFFTTKPVGKGTGLGLPMVYGFMKQSGGHIKIYSEPGRGTTVRLFLPLADRPAAAAPEPPRAIVPVQNQTVLVVEDDTDVRDLTSTLLSVLGYRVVAADTVAAAVARGGEIASLDVLLSDLVLAHGETGLDVAAAATRGRPAVRIVYMSGYAQHALLEQVQPDPRAQLLQKPFTRQALAEALQAAQPGPAAG